MVVTQDGFPSLDLTVSEITVNPAVDITVPDNVKAFQPPPVMVTADKLADGVFYLKGGTHHSLAIEMADHLILVEAPLNDARSGAVFAKAKTLAPGKHLFWLGAGRIAVLAPAGGRGAREPVHADRGVRVGDTGAVVVLERGGGDRRRW